MGYNVWEVRTTGSDSNGGGFDPSLAGTDYSVQDAPLITCTDLAIGSSNTTATSSQIGFTTAHKGNWLNVTAGTGFTVQRRKITAVSGGVATFDAALGTASSTGGSATLGGALHSPGIAGGLAVNNNSDLIFLKYHATNVYTITSGSNGVAGGRLYVGNSQVFVAGYDTTRTLWNADPNRPTLRQGTNNLVLAFLDNGPGLFRNLVFDNPSAFTGGTAVATGYKSRVRDCKVTGIANGVNLANWGNSANNWALDCEFSGCSGYGASGITTGGTGCHRCWAHDSTGYGFKFVTECIDSLASNTTGGGFYSIQEIDHCAAHGINTGGVFGFFFNHDYPSFGSNLIATNCVTGFAQNGTDVSTFLTNFACYGNTTDVQSSSLAAVNYSGQITLTGLPWMNAGTNDFRLNSVAGQGAALRGAGWPATFAGQANYRDVGPYQHQDAGGSSGPTYFAF